jgi:hypothetical protein
VNGNPVSRVDPSGQLVFVVPVLIGAAWGAGTDLAIQLLLNGGRIDCVNWGQVAVGAGLGAVGGAIGGTLSKLREIRQAYQTGLAAAREAGLGPEAAHGARRALGQGLKAETPWPFRDIIYQRNLARYGDPLGPAFDPVKHADPIKTLTDTNALADSLLKLPSKGLPTTGGITGGAIAGASGCGCK